MLKCPQCGSKFFIKDIGDFLIWEYCLDCDYEKEEYINY